MCRMLLLTACWICSALDVAGPNIQNSMHFATVFFYPNTQPLLLMMLVVMSKIGAIFVKFGLKVSQRR